MNRMFYQPAMFNYQIPNLLEMYPDKAGDCSQATLMEHPKRVPKKEVKKFEIKNIDEEFPLL